MKIRNRIFFSLILIVMARFELAFAQKTIFTKDLEIRSNINDEKTSFIYADFVDSDSKGNIYVLAARECKVQVYNPKGEYLRTIGKKGQGPGELEMAVCLLLDKDDHLYVFDFAKLAFVVFDPQGRYLMNLSTKGKLQEFPDRIILDPRGNFVIGYESIPEESFKITLFDKDFSRAEDLYVRTGVTSLLKKPGGVVTQAPFVHEVVWTQDERGNIYVCFNKTYDIEVYTPERKFIRRITKEVIPDEISKEEIDEQVKRSRGFLTAGDFPKYKPVLRRMFIVDRRLFVLVKRSRETFLFHVFDQKGDFIEELNLDFQPWIFKNGYLYTMKDDRDSDKCEVLRFKVEFK